MTYGDLKTNVQDITEMTFTDAQLGMFTKQAEQKIYDYVKGLPLLRKTKQESVTTINGLTLPEDCMYVHSVTAVTSSQSGNSNKALLNKSIDFLDEAYPKQAEGTSGKPDYYALTNLGSDDDLFGSRLKIAFKPSYSGAFSCIVDYHFRPRSITTAIPDDNDEVWLGENYDAVLLNGVLVEAARFMKAEPDIQQMYQEQYVMALTQLSDTTNTRMKSDSFRPQSPAAGPMPPAVPSEPT